MQEMMDVCGKFALAVVLGGALGLERELTGHAAGLRTHVLVCLGATLMMVVSDYLVQNLGGGTSPAILDRARIAAGIITGIGFLGAGAIMNVRNEQKGLTTAAMVWLVAAIGIAIGAGTLFPAVAATVFALVTVLGLEYIEQIIPANRRFVLDMRMPKDFARIRQVEEAIREKSFKVAASRVTISERKEYLDMTFDLTAAKGGELEALAAQLSEKFPEAKKITCERQ